MFDSSWCYFDLLNDSLNDPLNDCNDVTPKMHHLATLTTPPKPARFDHSGRLSERKRALFPSQIQDSDDSDIGHMSPLEYSSSPEPLRQNSPVSSGAKRYFGLDQTNRMERFSPDLEPIQDSDESNDVVCSGRFSPNIVQFLHQNLQNQENIDPKSSPTKHQKSVTFEEDFGALPKSPDITTIPDTPAMSPTEILKTPHDSNNTNQKVPRLVRKSLIDITNIDTTNLKRKSESPIESPANKTLKSEHHQLKSKARTALFPESIFPAKSFYPKVEAKTAPLYHVDSTIKTKKKSAKQSPVYLCNRSRSTQTKKNSFGLINAGVRHKIKKPRLKPALSKTQLLKAALNIVKNSPLNDYFDAIAKPNSVSECGVSYEQIQKMDSILKNLDVKSIQAQPLSVLQERKPNLAHLQGNHHGMKRSRSPQDDQTKKFFKSGHANKATFTISNNIKFQVEHGEMSLIEKQHKSRRLAKRETIEYNSHDFSFNEETEKMNDTSFSDILKTLENDTISPSTTPPLQNTHSITSHNSVTTAHNSAITAATKPEHQQLHSGRLPQFNNNMLLSPTSLVCDLTSGLALDSPKNQPLPPSLSLNKLSTLKKRISFPENMDNQKLFPIFYGKQSDPKPAAKENKHVKNIRKIWKPLSADQTLIDAGQRKFGLTQCAECKCVYSLGEPEDEIMHFQHHNSVSVLRYNCWKHERVVNYFSNGKVIQVNPNDPKSWLKKVKDLLDVVNRELGFVDVPFHMINQKVFLCIMNKQIVGCLVAEPKTHAHKMLPNQNTIDQCTEETFPIKCGVSRLWVAMTHRNKGVGTCLMNAMRSNFMYGHILSTHEIAFSAPTEAGKKFASKYTKTEEFLIYTS